MLRQPLTLLLSLLLCTGGLAQENQSRKYNYDPKTEKVYAVDLWLDGLAIGIGGNLLGAYGIDRVQAKDDVVLDFDRADVPGFDRWAFPDRAEARERAAETSDLAFHGSMWLPGVLFLSKKIRKDWLDITALYLETHAFNSLTYGWSPIGAKFIDRIRPISYYSLEELGITGEDDPRVEGNNRNSFFSGHVSTTAVGTFFFAKVLCDYNPQFTGKQKALIYAAASLPPIFTSVQRVRALKHFPSDTVMGFAVGAFFGVMNPHVHKNWQRKHRSRLSLSGGYGGGFGGAGVRLVF